MSGPRTPAEFRCIALKAIDLSKCPDPRTVEAALDETIELIEAVACGLAEPTACQKFVGQVFVTAIEEYLRDHVPPL